jgi:sulfur carrier protein ThiS
VAEITFTKHLERFLSVPSLSAAGSTVRAVLGSVFEDNPDLQGYVLDDQGRLRKHVAVFVNGRMIRDRNGLSDIVDETSQIYVMQALSGG